MRLVIAEKPSVARAIAQCLGSIGKAEGLIKCGSDVVTWCFGHMLEQVEPDHYLADDVPIGKTGKKVSRSEDLPIVPTQWVLQPKPDAKQQLAVIKKLLSQASEVINAGDPDWEGQLLVDEVLEHFKWTGKTLRYWASAQDPASVKRGPSGSTAERQIQRLERRRTRPGPRRLAHWDEPNPSIHTQRQPQRPARAIDRGPRADANASDRRGARF